jgi:hypothetical protein
MEVKKPIYDPKKWEPGKFAERCVQDWLEARCRMYRDFAWHRYPDSRSARNPIAAQPSDFLAAQLEGRPERYLRRTKAVHIEVKEVAEQTRLPRSKIRQYGKLKLFDWAAFDTIVIVFITSLNKWCYLNAPQLFDYDEDELPVSFNLRSQETFELCDDILNFTFRKGSSE